MHKVEVMEGWQNYMEWFQKNQYKKKQICIYHLQIYTILGCWLNDSRFWENQLPKLRDVGITSCRLVKDQWWM
jgi:hypothetical protein